MSSAADLLAAYDDQLRGEPEVAGATGVQRLGPLWIGVFQGRRGFITARGYDGVDAAAFPALVAEALGIAVGDRRVRAVEWKTRGHDVAPGLLEALAGAGFVAQEPESIMVGAAESLAVEVPLPDGVRIRSVTEEADIRAASAAADEVFEGRVSEGRAEELIARVSRGTEVWVAETAGGIVSSGRLEPVPGTGFAGLWGGATHPDWRGRGIYRALTAARARSAIRLGKRYLHSDSTEFSRPILERSGLVRVSTTTPYEFTVG